MIIQLKLSKIYMNDNQYSYISNKNRFFRIINRNLSTGYFIDKNRNKLSNHLITIHYPNKIYNKRQLLENINSELVLVQSFNNKNMIIEIKIKFFFNNFLNLVEFLLYIISKFSQK